MCKIRGTACCKIRKLENAVRATNQSFKLGKSWVISPICSNLFVVWTQLGTRKLSGLKLDLWIALLFSPSNMKIEADAAPPFLETKQKMSVSRFKEFPGWRGNNVFCALWKTKKRGRKTRRAGLVVFAPWGALPRCWGEFFLEIGKPEKYTKCKNLAFFVHFQRGNLGFWVENFFTT